MTRRRRVLIGGVILLIAAAVIAVVLVLFLRGLSRPGEATAAFLPADTQVYASINLRPGAGQLRLAREFVSLLQTDAFIDRRNELLEKIEDDTGIHFLDDVEPWIGTDVTFALLSSGPENAEWVVMAQVKDRDSALDFIDDLVRSLSDELHTDFDRDTYRGAQLWIADSEDVAIGITDEYLLIAGNAATLTGMVRDLASPPTRPLAEAPLFMTARESLPEDRVMFTFVQAQELIDSFEEMVGEFGDEAQALAGLKRSTPEYLAISASFLKRGFRLDITSDTPAGAVTLSSDRSVQGPDVLPADTVFILAGVGVGEMWERFWESLEDLEPDAVNEAERFVKDFEESTEINIERDIVNALSGEVALALLPSDIRFNRYEGVESGTVQGLLLAGVQDSQSIERVLDRFVELIQEEGGINFDRVELGGHTVVAPTGDDIDDALMGHSPGYSVTGEWLAVGSTRDSLQRFFDTLSGDIGALTSAPEFARLAGLAPEPHHVLLYADIAAILEMVDRSLDPDARYDYRREVEPLIEPLSTLFITGSATAEQSQVTMVLTLQE